MARKKGLGLFGFLLGIRVKLSLKEADQYLIYHSDEDSERIIGATLNGETHLDFTAKEVKRWKSEKEKRDRENAILHKTAALNNKGIALEKEGKVGDAINVYEENIKSDYPASHSYKRLTVLYRKQKDFDNEERIIKRAREILPREKKYYDDRLIKCIRLREKHK